jgi:curved DNA-binding protein CbpA
MASETDLKIDFYSLLGVERNASKETILKAFRQRARLFHPDKNPGYEDLMKLLNTAKITLIDPEKRALYDGPDEDDIPEEENIFLSMGKRLSESFIGKIEIWLKEFDSLEIKDNFEVIHRKYNELKEALAEICEEIPNEDFLFNSSSKYSKLLNNSKKNSSLAEKFAHQVPDQIWSMTGVNSNRILFKQIFIKTFGNWKNSGDKFFARDHYKTALFCYKKDSCNKVILKKAHQLYEKKKYEISLLYFRHLFDFVEYKPISSLMMINILQNLEKDIFDVALHSAYEFRNEAELHKIVSKQLIEKDMIYEAKDALDTAIQLRSDIKKDVISEHNDLKKKCEQKYYNDLRALVYEFEIQKIVICIKENSYYAVIDKLYTELTKGQNISELQPKYRATLSILKGAFLQLENKFDESFECFRDALLLYPFEDTYSAVNILMDDNYIKQSGQQLLYQIKSSQVEFPAVHEYAGMLRSSPLLRTIIKYEKSVQNQKISDFEKAMLYIDLSMACGYPCLRANNFLIAANFLINAMKAEDNLAIKYAFRNAVCDLCANVLFLANNYMNPVLVTHFVKMSLILMNSSHEILKLSLGKNKKRLGKK